MHLGIRVLSNTIPSYTIVVHSPPSVDRSCFHAACLEHGFFESRITQHIVTFLYTHTDLLPVNKSCNILKCFLKKTMAFPLHPRKVWWIAQAEYQCLHVINSIKILEHRIWKNEMISILREKLFNQSFRLLCMVKQLNAQLFKQRKVLCVHISLISTSVSSPRLFN
jgi:hypothetical protein